MLKISSVEKNSVGSELRLKKGYEVLSFDGYPACDVIDYLYYDSRDEFTLCVADANGKEFEFEIEKDEDETLGLSFEDDGLEMKTCYNNCIFCFVDQMPKGLRPTLYVKDDDYRQSFFCGNFVTLTNLTENDVERIVRYKLSPLYVSVHTMNGQLRERMMNNRFAGKITEYLTRFAAAEILINTQIVLVPGVNDGDELDYSARELFKLFPYVHTLAVVPCGITKYREGLHPIEDAPPDYCRGVIEQVDRLNSEFGTNFVTLADEFYFKAGLNVKPFEFYGEFPQIENGVGMTAKFLRELEESLEPRECERTLLIATGTSAEGFIRGCAKMVEERCKSLKTHVIGVENKFFGSTVNCSGLLTGRDILAAVKAFDKPYDALVIPCNTLREFEEVFLCGMTVSELSKEIDKPVLVTDGTGEGFFEVLTSK
ncbi:MAG: DUF512 domain-containing protein [Clostridia bacterium]|nr:DUF512 domain-containing protein [Clostridia bacterium]